jgi:CHAD domain-containing protein
MSSKIQSKDLDIRRFSSEQACHFVEAIFENAPGARSGENLECLHDMRVASRRLRETLQLFGMFYRPSRLRKTLDQAKKMTRILGLPREMDVNLSLLQEFEGDSDPVVRTTHEHLLETFERKQAKLRKKMHKTLDALNLKSLRAQWINFAQTALLAPKPQSMLSGIQREFESEAYLRQTTAILRHKAVPLLAFRSTPLHSQTDENLHRLRIVLKKLRYALEIYDPLHDHRFEKAIQSAKELQEVLGKVHDYSVLIEQLQAHKIDLQGKSRLRLPAGCERVIEFFEKRKNCLYPLLEPSYTTMTKELSTVLTPKSPLQFPLSKRKRNVGPKPAAAMPPLKDDVDLSAG